MKIDEPGHERQPRQFHRTGAARIYVRAGFHDPSFLDEDGAGAKLLVCRKQTGGEKEKRPVTVIL
jgi:hypothetical protein